VANENGVGYATFTFRVVDDGGTANSGVDSSGVQTITIDVNDVNDAPATADATVDVDEDGTYTFTNGDFAFSDVNDGPDAFQEISIASLPASGTLSYNGGAITSIGRNSYTDRTLFTYDPVANENGVGYATFTFRVVDDGGTANSGVDSSGVQTITIDVNSVNDAPATTDATVDVDEDGTYTFSTGDFAFSDVNDAPDNFQEISIASLPTSGTLSYNGTPISAIGRNSYTDRTLFTFDPVANENGVGYATFTFRVVDDGGTANSGVDSSGVQTITIDVNSVNDAPSTADATVAVDEDAIYTFEVSDFAFSDVNDAPNNFQEISIVTLPADGTLSYNGSAITSIGRDGYSDRTLFTFLPDANDNGVGYTTFTFRVVDDGGTANNGVDSSDVQTITVDVNPVNDPPTGTDKTLAIQQNSVLTVSTADLGYNDVEGDPLTQIKIQALPTEGILYLDADDNDTLTGGEALALFATISLVDLDADRLQFVPLVDSFGSPYATFDFNVTDGMDTAVANNTITINVTEFPNDAPTAADKTLTTLEDTNLTVVFSDLGYNDTDGDALDYLTVSSLGGSGTWYVDANANDDYDAGEELSANDTVGDSDLNGDNLQFEPDANDHGSGYATLVFVVNDGTEDAAASSILTVDVTSVNDAPSSANATVSTNEDTEYTFQNSDFAFTDATDNPANAFQEIVIVSLPAVGTLTYDGTEITSSGRGSYTDRTKFAFDPVGDSSGTGYATFTFRVVDDGGIANNGVDSSAAFTITVDVTPQNDAPVITDFTVSTSEDVAYDFVATDFTDNYSDADGDALLSIEITVLPDSGTLKLSNVDVVVNQVIVGADLGNLTYDPNPGYNGTDEFTWTANDGTEDSNTATGTINIGATNDPPTVDDFSVSTDEDTPIDFTKDNFTDNFDDVDGDTLFSIRITVLPTDGVLSIDGDVVQVDDVITPAQLDSLTYTPTDDFNGSDSFSFTGSDGAVDSNTGEVSITVNPVNDPPTADDFSVSTDVDTPVGLDKGDFTDNFDDADNDTLASIRIIVIPADGVLTIGDDTLQVGDVIVPNRLDSLVYDPTDGFTGSDSFDWTGSDGTEDSDTATVTIDVNEVNTPPDADDFTVTTDEDTPADLDKSDFTDNFTDADNDTLASIRIIVIPTDGVLTIGEDTLQVGDVIVPNRLDSLVYHPTDGFTGGDTFDWTGSDGEDDSDTATVTIDVNPVVVVNNPPDVDDFTVTTDEDTPAELDKEDFTDNFTDADNDTLASIKILVIPTDGVLTIGDDTLSVGDVIEPNRLDSLVYHPTDGFTGSDSFDWTGSDGEDDSDAATVTIDVNPVVVVNNPPDVDDFTVTTDEDTPAELDKDDFTDNFTDSDNDTLNSIRIIVIPTDGVLT
ncbi:MAG TPA: hypothetical protein DCP28_33470, partial [Cytophagales bacterium]|nr:hypothetical protein [Cytophagales bacterium]